MTGRPSKPKAEIFDKLHISLPPILHLKLKQESQDRQIPKSTIIRWALEEYLAEVILHENS